MIYAAPIAQLADLKARLGITDTTDDEVLAEMLLAVTGAIESAAGRTLRRQHCLREQMQGGCESIRTHCYPIAQVHWIRESETYDFDNPDNYTELVKGTDWIFDPAKVGRRGGEDGWIRRIGGRFMGSRSLPGMVEICYTSGYKTPDEAAAETSSVVISGSSNTTLAEAFSIAAHYPSGSSTEGYAIQGIQDTTTEVGPVYSLPNAVIRRGILLFECGDVLPPSWRAIQATLGMYVARTTGSSATAVDCYLMSRVNPRELLDSPESLWQATEDAIEDANQVMYDLAISSGSYASSGVAVHSVFNYGANMEALNAALRRGFIAFLFVASNETVGQNLSLGIETPRAATAGQRPSLTVKCARAFADPYSMPNDLKHAVLLQCAQDWQIRMDPGFRQQTQRGVSISSGISYLRDPATLLPEVLQIAQSYAEYT